MSIFGWYYDFAHHILKYSFLSVCDGRNYALELRGRFPDTMARTNYNLKVAIGMETYLTILRARLSKKLPL
ncbi:7523_t:CDS:2 [Entrophospora sp. SA101]|nr:7523_t:CDS:2 [Entrophospora sp. SA101]